MKYGEKYQTALRSIPYTATYKYAEWRGYHTDKEGNGLWHGDKQIIGICYFTVAGCKTEKAAKAKIRRYVNKNNFYEGR